MFDRNSDYALNKKDPDAIVCKSATGIHIRLTRLDFSSQEEFENGNNGLTRTTTTRRKRIMCMPTTLSRRTNWWRSPSP